MEDLYAALKQYWGYDSFRPLQERIIQSLVTGNDVAVVMPTGGGKSLCYQLPAVSLGRTVVVISPLIALMQDQVAQLGQMGIPAAVVNSTQSTEEQRSVVRSAMAGAYRLLYISPERLARPDTVAWLQRVPLAFFAIDEAHCISEWGHEFRPEYRQLSSLRQNFPDQPIAAFTASATRRVRQDILDQLQLREPHKYIASFHRANLRYILEQCDRETHRPRLMAAMQAYQGQSVIVYAPTIATVEETADYLQERGIPAVPYHGQMETPRRRVNQERWMNDEVRVLVGTIAFGLGINKPAVRAVIHTSMPKSIEQYYQEAGRAGRDGLPADCVMLWQPKDAGLLAYFIQKLNDPAERQRAWQRYNEVHTFVEGQRCRHLRICLHFGQTPKWERCGMCDVCGNLPDWMRQPVPDLRVRKKRAHRPLTPQVDGEAEAAPIDSVTPAPVVESQEPPADPDLVEYFKQWRRRTAQRAGVPHFVVLHDSALEDLCRKQPRDRQELMGVAGFGERKVEMYGDEILAAFEAFRRGDRATAQEGRLSSPAEETLRLLGEGKSFEEIARIRGRQLATVVSMVADLVEKGNLEYRVDWVGEAQHVQIEETVARLGSQFLKPIKEALPSGITWEQIRLVVAYVRRTAHAPAAS